MGGKVNPGKPVAGSRQSISMGGTHLLFINEFIKS